MPEIGEASPPIQETVSPAPYTEAEAAPEKKLLNKEMAGAQAMSLLGTRPGEALNTSKLEEIAKGKAPNTQEATKGSFNERDEYWNDEAFKGKDVMALWEESMDNFLDQYKGTDREAFFKGIGIDLEKGASAKDVYRIFIQENKGDVGYLAQQIAANNTSDQIEANREIIQKFAKIYGENSAQVTMLLTEGLKNVQTDPDSFAEAAQDQIQKGEQMPGRDIIQTMHQHSERWHAKQQKADEQRQEQLQQEEKQKQEEERKRKELEESKRQEIEEELQQQTKNEPETNTASKGEIIQLTNPNDVVNEMRAAIVNSSKDSLTLESSPNILIPFLQKELAEKYNIEEPITATIIDNDDKTEKLLVVQGKVAKPGMLGGSVKFNLVLKNEGAGLKAVRREHDLEYGGLASAMSGKIEGKIAQMNDLMKDQIDGQIHPFGEIEGLHIGDGVIECKVRKTQPQAQAA